MPVAPAQKSPVRAFSPRGALFQTRAAARSSLCVPPGLNTHWQASPTPPTGTIPLPTGSAIPAPTKMAEEKYLIYGKNGWIGGKLIELLKEQGKTVVLGDARLENREALFAEIDRVKPTHILNAAGVTGRPNIDWCETHQVETLRTNVIGTLNVADAAHSKGVHMTLYATGCIFEYDEAHPIGGPGFTEEDKPNFDGSFYSKTKAYMEDMLKSYNNVLILRVRMPISDDLNPRNFVTKIVKYDKVVDVPNSMTVLTDLLPVSLTMAQRKLTGVYNFTNPGAISHNEILALYKKYVDPSYTWTNFTIEEQNKILAARRSNNLLDTTKFVGALPDVHIPEIHEACEKVFQRMRVNLEKEGVWPDKLPKRGNGIAAPPSS